MISVWKRIGSYVRYYSSHSHDYISFPPSTFTTQTFLPLPTTPIPSQHVPHVRLHSLIHPSSPSPSSLPSPILNPASSTFRYPSPHFLPSVIPFVSPLLNLTRPHATNAFPFTPSFPSPWYKRQYCFTTFLKLYRTK